VELVGAEVADERQEGVAKVTGEALVLASSPSSALVMKERTLR
jgi:hypothetical protein